MTEDAMAEAADGQVDAVKSGAIKKFVVMAGCFGRAKSRNCYTAFAKTTPNAERRKIGVFLPQAAQNISITS